MATFSSKTSPVKHIKLVEVETPKPDINDDTSQQVMLSNLSKGQQQQQQQQQQITSNVETNNDIYINEKENKTENENKSNLFLGFNDIRLSILDPKTKENKFILDGVSGMVYIICNYPILIKYIYILYHIHN